MTCEPRPGLGGRSWPPQEAPTDGEHSERPNRWLHVRLVHPFTELQWGSFKAHCRLFRAHAEALLSEWEALGNAHPAPLYSFFPPELSEDRITASLPLGGEQTLGSRATIENGCSYLLWSYMLSCVPIEEYAVIQEGLTEPSLSHPSRFATNWRRAQRSDALPSGSSRKARTIDVPTSEIAHALAVLDSIGVRPNAAAPPLFRFLWSLRIPVMPPLFLSPITVFAGFSVLCALGFGICMAGLSPILADTPPSFSRFVFSSLIFGCATAAVFTMVYRSRARSLNLPKVGGEPPAA